MMFNSQRPDADDLPSNAQLLKATAFAALTSVALLVLVILPAEYAIDPTGAGRMLGFTEMGEVKAQLAQEAAADAMNSEVTGESTVAKDASGTGAAPAAETRSDVMELTLAPGQAAEIKATMVKGASVNFVWKVEGGTVNFDTHADAPGIDYHGYGKGQSSPGEEGVLVAAFDGKHGWFWRNRSIGEVTITLKTEGAYSEIKRVA